MHPMYRESSTEERNMVETAQKRPVSEGSKQGGREGLHSIGLGLGLGLSMQDLSVYEVVSPSFKGWPHSGRPIVV